MSVTLLEPGMPLPDPGQAEPMGLVAAGGDLRPQTLLDAYSKGIFPWYEKDPILWFSPDPRTVLVPEDLHVSRSLRRTLRKGAFEVRLDTAFAPVIRACAEVPRRTPAGTWINPDMIRAYRDLHRLGYAHSVEAWREGRLVGGLYGVSLGSAFFGESMFTHEDNASKVALVRFVEQLRVWGFRLFDCQIQTAHVAGFGATEWERRRFLRTLREALRSPTRRGRWTFDTTDMPEPHT